MIIAACGGGCLSGEDDGGGSFGSEGNGGGTKKSNNRPVISGTPASAIMVGDTYGFTPTASDADGDRLTFSIANKPRWANFDSASGRLSGQVLLGDVGVYENIRISVSDGNATTSLREFSVTVSQTALGSMTLSWTAPTENTDGSTLTNLAGFNIYYGKSRGNYPDRITIDNPSISTYVVENLVPDTYYVVATSFNSAGVESAYSNEAEMLVASD